jgi:hypothetical protein
MSHACCFHDCKEPGIVWVGENGNPNTKWSCVKHYEFRERLQRRIAEQRWMDDSIAYLDPDWQDGKML